MVSIIVPATPSLFQALHVFALAHILRRPIIVYGPRDVSEPDYQVELNTCRGVYLPWLLPPADCVRDPITLYVFIFNYTFCFHVIHFVCAVVASPRPTVCVIRSPCTFFKNVNIKYKI